MKTVSQFFEEFIPSEHDEADGTPSLDRVLPVSFYEFMQNTDGVPCWPVLSGDEVLPTGLVISPVKGGKREFWAANGALHEVACAIATHLMRTRGCPVSDELHNMLSLLTYPNSAEARDVRLSLVESHGGVQPPPGYKVGMYEGEYFREVPLLYRPLDSEGNTLATPQEMQTALAFMFQVLTPSWFLEPPMLDVEHREGYLMFARAMRHSFRDLFFCTHNDDLNLMAICPIDAATKLLPGVTHSDVSSDAFWFTRPKSDYYETAAILARRPFAQNITSLKFDGEDIKDDVLVGGDVEFTPSSRAKLELQAFGTTVTCRVSEPLVFPDKLFVVVDMFLKLEHEATRDKHRNARDGEWV